MNLSVKDIDGDIIVFSIYPSCLDQERKSSFLYKASKPEIAVPMYEEFVAQMQKDLGKKVQTRFWCRYESSIIK
jgi:D-tyrosyl-tRNA(Tyr) deacylase